MSESPVGLRERKKRQTREAIVDAAMRLFAERGFNGTTIADIAAEADIAPRTFFAYFGSKEEVVFGDSDAKLESLRAAIEERGPGETTIDALRAWLLSMVQETGLDESRERCRQELIAENASLDAQDRRVIGQFEEVLKEGLLEDLGGAASEMRARMVAASAAVTLRTLGELYKADPVRVEADPMAVVDEALQFLHAGLASLRDDA
jgi:AcrR family transcriptional regulator